MTHVDSKERLPTVSFCDGLESTVLLCATGDLLHPAGVLRSLLMARVAS
jgi:hypothetical protein